MKSNDAETLQWVSYVYAAKISVCRFSEDNRPENAKPRASIPQLPVPSFGFSVTRYLATYLLGNTITQFSAATVV